MPFLYEVASHLKNYHFSDYYIVIQNKCKIKKLNWYVNKIFTPGLYQVDVAESCCLVSQV